MLRNHSKEVIEGIQPQQVKQKIIMSHFTVLVIGDNPEGQLAPFQENNMGDCPREYMEFENKEEELRKDYEEDTITRVVMPNGNLVSPYDEMFRVSGVGIGTGTHKVPSHFHKREVPVKELYPSFEKYAEEYQGYKKDPETGKYGYWKNPNAKWDWYSLGGRWAGFFKMKPHTEGIQGHHRAKDFAAITGEVVADLALDVCDQAYKRDIAFEVMRDEAAQEAAKKWELANAIIGHLPMCRPWSEIGKEMNYSDAARALYGSQERVIAWREAEKKDFKNWPFSWRSGPEEFSISKEDFIQNARNSAISTHAVIKDGKWYERGEMGWWAIVSNENDDWDKEFSRLLDSTPDNTLLSVYDCHI